MKIAILAHSTNPRGGVVHALELADALCRLGHQAVAHAPDPGGHGFFRETLCPAIGVTAAPVGGDTESMARTRIDDYVRHFEIPDHRRFDLFHAQDAISGNALVTLKQRGLIPRFVRTVHHIDTFDDPTLMALQRRSIACADHHVVVSHLWQDVLREDWGISADMVGNGVDTSRFTPHADDTDQDLRDRLGLTPDDPVFLAVGGVEARKNTIRMLRAFGLVAGDVPRARLVIAGGASLLDHGAYQAAFAQAMAASGLRPESVVRTGPIPQRLMPALYRAARALAFASVKEGFGLVVLEAMACGVPVVTSRIAPFTEYLGSDDVFFCDPLSVPEIARAMRRALDPASRARVVARGHVVAARHDWALSARQHLAAYAKATEPANA